MKGPTHKRTDAGFLGWKVALFVVFVVAAGVMAVGVRLARQKDAEQARRKGEAEIAQLKLDYERMRGEVDRAQAERAKAEAELAQVKAERDEATAAAEKARANSNGESAKEIAQREEQKRQ